MIALSVGLGALCLCLFGLGCRQLSRLRREVEGVDEQLDQFRQWCREVQPVQRHRADTVDARIDRLETSTTLLVERHDEMARHVEWIGTWVRHWVTSLQKRRR